MKNHGCVAMVALCGLVFTGCTDTEDVDIDMLDSQDAYDFREAGADVEFWEFGLEQPANGEIEVHEGDDTDVPDCLIWDIDTPNVQRQVQLGIFSDRFVVEDNEIFEVSEDPAETQSTVPVCSAEIDGSSFETHFQLVDASGEVVITLWNRLVFIGDVEIPPFLSAEFWHLVTHDVAFSFRRDHIYDGPWWEDKILATSTESLNRANPMRRLLLSALVAGECGSNGLP